MTGTKYYKMNNTKDTVVKSSPHIKCCTNFFYKCLIKKVSRWVYAVTQNTVMLLYFIKKAIKTILSMFAVTVILILLTIPYNMQ